MKAPNPARLLTLLISITLAAGDVAAADVEAAVATVSEEPTITVGSKNFSESYLLAEIMAQTLESGGYRVVRKFGLGGTLNE